MHPQIGEIIKGLVARKKYIYLCTNALLLKEKIHLFQPSRYLTFSVHLDGLRAEQETASANGYKVFDPVSEEKAFERLYNACRAGGQTELAPVGVGAVVDRSDFSLREVGLLSSQQAVDRNAEDVFVDRRLGDGAQF